MGGAGRRVTKSFTSRGAFSPLRPSRSQRAERVSAQVLTKPASSSLTTSSTAAKSRSIRVTRSIKRRARWVPDTLSQARIRAKKSGTRKPGYSLTAVDSSQNRMEGAGLPLV